MIPNEVQKHLKDVLPLARGLMEEAELVEGKTRSAPVHLAGFRAIYQMAFRSALMWKMGLEHELAGYLRYYRKQAERLGPEWIEVLRRIGDGEAIYESSKYRVIDSLTYVDGDGRLRLNDSALALLFAIEPDCTWPEAEGRGQ